MMIANSATISKVICLCSKDKWLNVVWEDST